jgi:L-iditol 2-dehydrogenase
MNNLSLTWSAKNHLKFINKKINFPIPKENILIKVKSVSICGSDLRILKNGSKRVKSGRTIGHELSGTVYQIGPDVKTFKVGDTVSLGADFPCEKCYYCENDQSNNCIHNSAIGHEKEGGFAKFILLDKDFLSAGPIKKFDNRKISFDEACLAEPLACCLNGFSKVGNVSNKNVLIFGAGSIGNLLCMLALYYKANKVFLADIDQKKLDISKQIHGKNVIMINIKKKNLKKTILNKTDKLGCQTIFTACSNISAIKDSFEILSKNSCLNIFGGLPKNQKMKLNLLPNFFHYNEVTITGSHGSTPKQHINAINLIEKKKIKVKKIISKKFEFKDSLKAFEYAKNSNTIKVVINPNE